VAEKIRQKTGSVNVKGLKTEQLTNLFKEAVSEIIRWPDPTGRTHTAETFPGTFNLILSDGERIVASRYNPARNLYLGKHSNSTGENEYVLATDKMQPTDESGQAKIDWTLLPNNSVTVLEQGGKDAEHRVVTVHEPEVLVDEPKPAIMSKL
jgi:hypothetical protein